MQECILRHIQDAPPPSLPWGAWCTISLFCSNEFGLFRRSDFPCRDETRETLPLEFCAYEHGGRYCVASEGARTEVRPLSDGDDEDEEGDGAEGPVLRRNTSCRVQCRVRFLPSEEGRGAGVVGGDTASTRLVHMRVAVAPSLLSREVLPVISLPIRLLPQPASAGATDADPVGAVDARLGIKGCRAIYLPALGRALLCAESPGQAGIAGKVWTGGGRGRRMDGCGWMDGGKNVYAHAVGAVAGVQLEQALTRVALLSVYPLSSPLPLSGVGRRPRAHALPRSPAPRHRPAQTLRRVGGGYGRRGHCGGASGGTVGVGDGLGCEYTQSVGSSCSCEIGGWSARRRC